MTETVLREWPFPTEQIHEACLLRFPVHSTKAVVLSVVTRYTVESLPRPDGTIRSRTRPYPALVIRDYGMPKFMEDGCETNTVVAVPVPNTPAPVHCPPQAGRFLGDSITPDGTRVFFFEPTVSTARPGGTSTAESSGPRPASRAGAFATGCPQQRPASRLSNAEPAGTSGEPPPARERPQREG